MASWKEGASNSGRYLDVACGTGNYTARLAAFLVAEA
jgi:ubiquinone/menaquinone biosynthesis C-methylase UbiE